MVQNIHERPPFRAEHLGSLLRPDDLLKIKNAVEKKQVSEQDLVSVQDIAIKQIVQEQLRLGFHALSDGDYRRHMFWGTFFPGLDGFEEVSDPPIEGFREYAPDVGAFLEAGHKPGESVFCTGKIKHVGSTYLDQWNFLKGLLPADKVGAAKLTLAAPNWHHLRYHSGKAYPKEVYANDAEYFADVAAAYREELRILIQSCTDERTRLTTADFCSEKMLKGFKYSGENSTALFTSYIKLYNDCLRDRPADLHIGVHLCRGNFVGSRHFSEGGYDAIATSLFNDLNVDTYYLEYDTPRSGNFSPLSELPAHKNVIIGLITSKFPELEDLEDLKAKVYSAADIVAKGSGQTREEALKRIGVSPQCGFASHTDGNAVVRSDMMAKLKLVRRLADSIWPGEP